MIISKKRFPNKSNKNKNFLITNRKIPLEKNSKRKEDLLENNKRKDDLIVKNSKRKEDLLENNKRKNILIASNKIKAVLIFSILGTTVSSIYTLKIQQNKVAKIETYNSNYAKIKLALGSNVLLNYKNDLKSENTNIAGKNKESGAKNANCKESDIENVKNKEDGEENVKNKEDSEENGKNKKNGTENENNKESREENITYEKKHVVKLKTADESAPNNVEKIDTKVLENTMAINFSKPTDNGTSYSYLVKNKNGKNKSYNFYSESGIHGYCYEINDSSENTIKAEINKVDESPIVIQKIDWNKDYYIHIKTIDNNKNESDCKTIKLTLPSEGLKIRYVDLNTNEELCDEYIMNGNVNDDYDVKKYIKEINGYKIINMPENLTGKLKKNQTNIDIKYAKIKDVTIEYIDANTKNKIKPNKIQRSYEGEKINIVSPQISQYKSKSGNLNYVVNGGNNIVKLYYSKLTENRNKDANLNTITQDKATYQNGTQNGVTKQNTQIKTIQEKTTQNKTEKGIVPQNKTIKIRLIDSYTHKVVYEKNMILKLRKGTNKYYLEEFNVAE